MATGVRAPHDFCWINMITPDVAAAKEFYAVVLGWTYSEMPGMGWLIKVDDGGVGGMFDQNGPGTPPGTRAYIGIMIKVAELEATTQRIESLGGRVTKTMDIGTNGRMAVCFDPAGAEFDLWQPLGQPGMKVEALSHGAPSWFEVMQKDPGGAKVFYTSLFGWTTSVMQMPGSEYTTFELDGRGIGGMLPITADMGDMKPVWATYFTVKDVAAAVRQVTELGGSIHMPVTEIPTVGQFAYVQSPQGVMFYVIQYAPRG